MALVGRHHPNTHGPLPQLPLPQECGAFCANVPGSRYLLSWSWKHVNVSRLCSFDGRQRWEKIQIEGCYVHGVTCVNMSRCCFKLVGVNGKGGFFGRFVKGQLSVGDPKRFFFGVPASISSWFVSESSAETSRFSSSSFTNMCSEHVKQFWRNHFRGVSVMIYHRERERERDVLNGNEIHKSVRFWANYSDPSRGHRSGLVRECPPKALNSGLGIIVICPDKIKLINLSFSHLFCLCGVLPQVLSSIGWSIIQNGSGISRSGWNIVGFRLHFGGISKKIYGHTARRKWIWKST